MEGDVNANQTMQVVQVLHECSLDAAENQHMLMDPDHNEYEMDGAENDDGRRRSRKPLLALSIREKTAICRYKAQHPDVNQRQIAEHFTKLWGKDICRRRVSDILIQKEKWFDVERRVKGDADKTFRDGKFSALEKEVQDWITDQSRSGQRVWDDDIRKTAKRFAEMNEVKSFVASNGWLNGFKKRYGLKTSDEGFLSVEIDHTASEFATTRNGSQLQLQGTDGNSYTVNITVDPQDQTASAPCTGQQTMLGAQIAGPSEPVEGDLSDIEAGDSGDDTQDGSMANLQSMTTPSTTHMQNNVVNGEQNMGLDDLVKTIIYGGPSSSAQVMTAASTQATMNPAEQSINFRYYHENSSNSQQNGSLASTMKSRTENRARMTAILVRKVLVSTKRKLDAEADMIREQKQRHMYECKMLDERRKRLADERELIAAKKRKLEAQTKFLNEQQRNEVIRRELLLADVTATKNQTNPKQTKVHSGPPVPVQLPQQKQSYVTVVTGSSE